MLPVQGLGDEHLPEHGVDIEHLVGRLISADARDAVADRDVLILVRADLDGKEEKRGDRSLDQSMHLSSPLHAGDSRLYFFIKLLLR